MRTIIFLLSSLMLTLFILGCGEEAERENPLDAANERTGGVPPGMIARAGDSQIILSWPNMGFDGVKEYRIYQSYLTADKFQPIASVQSEPLNVKPEYTYTDAGLQNDGENQYFYRLTFVDENGIETPDTEVPESWPENWLENWFSVSAIPSEAPPKPDVEVKADTDLQIRLEWLTYSEIAPADLAGFRVFMGLGAEEGREQNFVLVYEYKIDEEAEGDPVFPTFYVHGNDYANNVINFSEDGITKTFRVVAFDMVDVESEPAEVKATSPNLPPSPPFITGVRWDLGLNSYEVTISWRTNLEPDVRGYVIYALKPDDTSEFKRVVNGRSENDIKISDQYVGFGEPKRYYVTAFDDTPKPDGKRDESEPSQIIGN